MSYEGDLVATYNRVHKKLLGSATVVKKTPPLVPPIPPDKNSLEALLLRIQALEDDNKLLQRRMEILEIKNEWRPNVYPRNPQDRPQKSMITMDDIFQMVATKEQFSQVALISPRRFYRLGVARSIIYYLCYFHTSKSLPQIGHFMHRDHTTVMKMKDKVIDRRTVDSELDARLCWYEMEIARLTEAKNRP